MGQGRFINKKLHFKVVANFAMSPQDWIDWERAFSKASEILFNATEGEVQFGEIFVSDNNLGIESAEIILHSSGDPSYATIGGFGQAGQAMHLMPYVKSEVLTLLHEFGHQIWSLREEYSTPFESADIDKSNDAPNKSTIPIIDTGLTDDSWVGGQALLLFGENWERRIVVSNTSTSITVDSEFSNLPTNSSRDDVLAQFSAQCSTSSTSNFCIMGNSRIAAGSFNLSTGVWTDAVNPVTEFCNFSNHDPDGDTYQQAEHGKSCWEVIVETEGYRGIRPPSGDASGIAPSSGLESIGWNKLEDQSRFALVLDRSGSMREGTKMADTKNGAIYWLEFNALTDDNLSIVSYNEESDIVLPLSNVGSLGDLSAETASINELRPSGGTNIREGLTSGLNEITSPGNLAGVQAVLLLSDGIHNSPPNTSATDVVEDFVRNSIQVYTLGIGSETETDMDTLDDIASGTLGVSSFVGNNDPAAIETALVTINAIIRGGILGSGSMDFPSPDSTQFPKEMLQLQKKYVDKKPQIEEVLQILKVNSGKEFLGSIDKFNSFAQSLRVFVEKGSKRSSFTVVYPDGEDFWLYLISPNGQFVEFDSLNIKYRKSQAPHEFIIVERPAEGDWHFVVVRASVGGKTKVTAIAGGENPNLQVYGGIRKNRKLLTKADPIEIFASARWVDEITNLKVIAKIADPLGVEHIVELKDLQKGLSDQGNYTGIFEPTMKGRHQGTIYIRNIKKAQKAKALHLVLHSLSDTISVASDAPKFERNIPFYFDAFDRPKIKINHQDAVNQPENPNNNAWLEKLLNWLRRISGLRTQ